MACRRDRSASSRLGRPRSPCSSEPDARTHWDSRRAPGAARGCRPERSVPPPPYSEPEPFVGKHGGKEHPALRLQFIGRRNQLHLGLVKQRRHYQRQLSLREPAAGAVVNPDAERRKHSRLLVLLTPWKVAVYVEPLGMGKVLQRQAAGQRQTGSGAARGGRRRTYDPHERRDRPPDQIQRLTISMRLRALTSSSAVRSFRQTSQALTRLTTTMSAGAGMSSLNSTRMMRSLTSSCTAPFVDG